MAAPTHVLTISRVAEILDEDKDWLYELARKMEPEDGMTHHLRRRQSTMTFSPTGRSSTRELVIDLKMKLATRL
jgi:hypothetical protein